MKWRQPRDVGVGTNEGGESFVALKTAAQKQK